VATSSIGSSPFSSWASTGSAAEFGLLPLGENANTDLAELGITQRSPSPSTIRLDPAWREHRAAGGTFVWAFATLRRGRLAFYIPVVGYLAFSAVLGVAITVLR